VVALAHFFLINYGRYLRYSGRSSVKSLDFIVNSFGLDEVYPAGDGGAVVLDENRSGYVGDTIAAHEDGCPLVGDVKVVNVDGGLMGSKLLGLLATGAAGAGMEEKKFHMYKNKIRATRGDQRPSRPRYFERVNL
jgi:hypothetical protein